MSTPTNDPWTVLVVAKAPVPGLAKTRLAASVGDEAAARLAAASLLDVLAAGAAAVGGTAAGRCHVSMTGSLDDATGSAEIRDALVGWVVHGQVGDALGERLARAHADAGPGPVVQVGMDTPQVTPDLLASLADALEPTDPQDDPAVLAPAADGGWWALGVRHTSAARVLAGVPMSTPTTYDDTHAALVAAGCRVSSAPELTDVDTARDAEVVAALAPHTRFARLWREVGDR